MTGVAAQTLQRKWYRGRARLRVRTSCSPTYENRIVPPSNQVINNPVSSETMAMLAEKFFLVLETLLSHASDASVKVVNTTRHVPISLTHANLNPPEPAPNRSSL